MAKPSLKRSCSLKQHEIKLQTPEVLAIGLVFYRLLIIVTDDRVLPFDEGLTFDGGLTFEEVESKTPCSITVKQTIFYRKLIFETMSVYSSILNATKH